MDRPHGSLRRRATLLIAAIAIIAIALIPRGVVRTTLAAADQQQPTNVSAVETSAPTLGLADTDDHRLPGVRALVAREEREAALHDASAIEVATSLPPSPTDPADRSAPQVDRADAPHSAEPSSPSGSRGPPVLS